MINRDGTTIPDTLLIGVTATEWIVQLFYEDGAAAKWLAEGSVSRRHVFRVRVEPIEELKYVPPVPAALKPEPVVLAQGEAEKAGLRVVSAIKAYEQENGSDGMKP